jgi:hypothetical protein
VRIAHAVAAKGYSDMGDEILDAAHEIGGRSLRGSVPSNDIMSSLANLMADLKIDYAVIGAIALGIHGQVRDTQDIDVLVSAMPPGDKTGDQSYMDKFTFYRGKSSTGTVMTLDHKGGGGYIEMLLANTPLFQWALSTAASTMVLGSQAPVVSAAALVALKTMAMVANPKRAAKDKADIVSVLTQTNPDLTDVWPRLSEAEVTALKPLVAASVTEEEAQS